jgi:hypothetical protein
MDPRIRIHILTRIDTTDPEHRLDGCGTVNIVDLWALVILF